MIAPAKLVMYGSEAIGYSVERRMRRKTLGIEVHPDLRVVVLAPPDCGNDDIQARVRRRARWIARQLERFRRYRPRTPPRRYVAGETHLYLGRQYRLKFAEGERENVVRTRSHLVVAAPNRLARAETERVVGAWYRRQAREIFAAILDKCFPALARRGLLRPRIEVRAMVRRWGSLSKKGRMTLNVNLLKAPPSCIEYVITHELCHLLHDHHGPRFYRLLTRLMPDWEKRKRHLEVALL